MQQMTCIRRTCRKRARAWRHRHRRFQETETHSQSKALYPAPSTRQKGRWET